MGSFAEAHRTKNTHRSALELVRNAKCNRHVERFPSGIRTLLLRNDFSEEKEEKEQIARDISSKNAMKSKN